MNYKLFEKVSGIALSLELPYKSPMTLPPVGAELLVERGTVWLTISGDSRDIILRAGQSWPIGKNGQVVIEATDMEGAALRLYKPIRPRPARSAGPGFVRPLLSRVLSVFGQKGWSTAAITGIGRQQLPGTRF